MDRENVIRELKAINASLCAFLEHGQRLREQNMRCIGRGIWIHKDYKNFGEALTFLKSILP